MSFSFSKDDVRNHLQDLGYSNITEEQLDEFMRDLRRLIRYEEKQKNVHRSGSKSEQRRRHKSVEDDSTSSKDSSESVVLKSPAKRSKSKHATRTVTAVHKSPSAPVLKNVTSTTRTHRQVRQRKVLRYKNGEAVIVDESIGTSYEESMISTCQSDSGHSTSRSTTSDSSSCFRDSADGENSEDVIVQIHVPDGSPMRKSRSMSALPYLGPERPHIPKRATTAFIRPQEVKPKHKDLKADPVRLYEYYKSQWDRQNFPGDGSDKDLRWRVREFMMGNKEK